MDRKERLTLVMVLGDWQFRAKHIPGSVNIPSPDDPLAAKLSRDEEIVVYCSGDSCVASVYAYKILKENGFTRVSRYAGGLADWEAAGYPLEGEMVEG